jgi:RNA polymerase sigma factor (sigma-70 family)
MDNLNDHLSRIQTLWSKLMVPGVGADQDETRQQELLLRYYRAAFRYLLGVVRNPGVAEELAQDFAVRFMRGDFRNVDRQRGRFRDFLKTVLRNLARDHWRKQQRAAEVQASADAAAVEPPAPAEAQGDAEFEASWREELLAKTWEALAQFEQTSGKPYFTALRLKVQEPELRSPELAEKLGKTLNKTISPEGLRQTLHRARESFGDALLHEVELSLESPEWERLEEELIALQLFDYCRAALRRRQA